MHVLVVGGSGLLGTELIRQCLDRGDHVAGTYFRSEPSNNGEEWHQLDVRSQPEVRALLVSIRPAIVINAAYRQSDWATTAEGAAHVAMAGEAVGAHSVLISSDAVFSGTGSPYRADAQPDPITEYGRAKAAAEASVRAIAPTATIIRTSLIVSDTGRSEHERRAHAAARGHVELFVDDIRCPVHVSDLAAAALELATARSSGTFHLAGPEAMSRYHLGRLVAQRDGDDPDQIRTGKRCEDRGGIAWLCRYAGNSRRRRALGR